MAEESFLDKAKRKPAAHFLAEWLPKLDVKEGVALDLGCGPGADAELFAKSGFMVDAIDLSEVAVNAAKERCKGLKVDVLQGDFREFEYRDDYYAIIYAHNALPFVPKEDFLRLVSTFRKSLKSGGYVILTVFGPEHAWAGRSDMNFWTKEAFGKLWDGFETVHVEEEKGMKPLISGSEIFQHRIHFIAKKPVSK